MSDIKLDEFPVLDTENTLPPFIELDKGQSVVLLNVVSFLYGTNTTYDLLKPS